MAGTQQRILVTDYSKKDPGMLQGRTEHNRIVNFRCDNPRLIGQFVDVHIDEALPHSLRGTLLEPVVSRSNATARHDRHAAAFFFTRRYSPPIFLQSRSTKSP